MLCYIDSLALMSLAQIVKLVPAAGCALSGSADGVIRIWDIGTQTCLWYCPGFFPATLSSFRPQLPFLPSLPISHSHILSSPTPSLHALPLHLYSIISLPMFWMPSFIAFLLFTGHIGPLLDIDVSVYPTFASTASGQDYTPRIWQISGFDPHVSDRVLHLLEGHDGNALCLGFAPDGKLLATGGADATVRVWRCEDAYCIRIFEHGRQAVTCLAVAGGLVATGSTDASIQIWDLVNLRRHCTFAGHHMAITSIDWADGRLVSSSQDGYTMVWGLAGQGQFRFAMDGKGIQSTKPDAANNVPEHIVVQAVQGDDIITKSLWGYPTLRTFNSSARTYARKAGPCGFMSGTNGTENLATNGSGEHANILPLAPPNTARDALAHYEVEIEELAELAGPSQHRFVAELVHVLC